MIISVDLHITNQNKGERSIFQSVVTHNFVKDSEKMGYADTVIDANSYIPNS